MVRIPRRCPPTILFAATLTLGCGLISSPEDEQIAALQARVGELEQARTASAKTYETRLQGIEASLLTQQQMLTAVATAPKTGKPTGATPSAAMDPSVRKRVDEVGVKMLEQMAGNESMQEAMGSLGDLANVYIQQEVKRAKRAKRAQ